MEATTSATTNEIHTGEIHGENNVLQRALKDVEQQVEDDLKSVIQKIIPTGFHSNMNKTTINNNICTCGEIGNIQYILFECNNRHNCDVLYNSLPITYKGPVNEIINCSAPIHDVLNTLASFLLASNSKL